MKNVYDMLVERGFVAQVTEEESLRERLQSDCLNFYVGFDPTAASLHVGSLVPIMAMMHMQQGGHRPLVLIGGGTGLIGDPSGKTEMRQLLTREQVDANVLGLQRQLAQYIDFRDNKACLLNNADWLTKLNYIEFLRDIGKHFSVNKMLSAESYRIRMEKGLNLIEFNYMLLQAYDFLHLFNTHHCQMQMGGNDQWGNILAGVDLIRRVKSKVAYGVTFPLLVTSRGHKMGKTERGTIWLEPLRTPPYEYYQYWINTDDADLERFLALFTFLPMDEIKRTGRLADAELNMAKAVLAFETTQITHGKQAALGALEKSSQLFGFRAIEPLLFPSSMIPRTDERGKAVEPVPSGSVCPLPAVERRRLNDGIPAFELFHETNLCASRSEARRLLVQGGAYVNDRQLANPEEKITDLDINSAGNILLRKGKKTYLVVAVVD